MVVIFSERGGKWKNVVVLNYNDSAQKTLAVRENVRGMNAPITNNATIIPTGFSSGLERGMELAGRYIKSPRRIVRVL